MSNTIISTKNESTAQSQKSQTLKQSFMTETENVPTDVLDPLSLAPRDKRPDIANITASRIELTTAAFLAKTQQTYAKKAWKIDESE